MGIKKRHLLLGIATLIMVIYWNGEIYDHRMHMGKAKEHFIKGDYEQSLDELKNGSNFPFNYKTQKYIDKVEHEIEREFKQSRINATMDAGNFIKYTDWLESEVLIPISSLYMEDAMIEVKESREMSMVFYRLNLVMQEKRVTLKKEYQDMHSYLIDYLNKSQLAYSHQAVGENLKAEELRLKAISSYTNFMALHYDEWSERCGGENKLFDYLY
jgi:hypothetical protein